MSGRGGIYNGPYGEKLFGDGKSVETVRTPDQRSTYDQLLSVYQLANKAGHYDAADWIMEHGIKPVQEAEKRLKKEEGA